MSRSKIFELLPLSDRGQGLFVLLRKRQYDARLIAINNSKNFFKKVLKMVSKRLTGNTM